MNGGEVEVTYELTRPIDESAEGNYSCIASNDIGVAMITLTVEVRSKCLFPPLCAVQCVMLIPFCCSY